MEQSEMPRVGTARGAEPAQKAADDPNDIFARPSPAAARAPSADGRSTGYAQHQTPSEPSAANTPGDRPKPADSKASKADPLRDLLTTLERAAAQVEFMSPSLAAGVRQLQRQSGEPGQTEQTGFRTRVAYALQEVEKVAGPVTVAPALREELTRLATTMPGLQNERMHDLLKATPGIGDPKLSSDIRIAAADIARQAQQDTPDIASRLDTLENRVRLAPRVPVPEAARAVGGEPPRAAAEGSARTSAVDAANAPFRAPRQPAGDRGDEHRDLSPSQIVVQSAGANALLNILAALRRPESSGPLPWDGPQDSLAERHRRFEQTVMAGRREDASLRGAELAGQAALEAVQGFNQGPGAGVLGKIQDAAKATPGGMAVVLSEMREGGRFAELREQFNAALATEKGFGAAYDRATTALAHYGEQRTGIVPILARRSETSAVAAKFEQLDAEIGQAASLLPGRKDGKNALEEIGDKTIALISKALDAVRGTFSPGPAARSGPSPAPSVSP